MNDSSQSTKQRKRSVVFWVFLIVSIPLITGVVGYASGYRFNTHSRTLTVTSLISVSTTPSEATVTLNGVAQTTLTPFMHAVEPGEYTITVTHDGYQPWEKRLTIAEGKSAVFTEALLFGNTPILEEAAFIEQPASVLRSLTPEEISTYASHGFTNTRTLLVMDSGSRPVVIDTQNDVTWLLGPTMQAESAVRIGAAAIDAQWSPDGTMLATMNDFELSIYELSTQKNSLIRRQSIPLSDMTWSTDSRLIFYSDADTISAVEVDPTGGRQRWVVANVSGATDLAAQKKQLQFTVNGKTFNDVLEE